MKKLFFLIGIMGLAVLGCDDEDRDNPPPPPPPRWVCEISIDIPQDTLYFIPGDSASMPITVVVNGYNGDGIEGEYVNISLDNPQLGFIEFVDTELRDTTNTLGRVNLIYTAVGIAGDNIIYASAGGVTRTKEFAIREQSLDDLVADLELMLVPDTLRLAAEGQEEPLYYCYAAWDADGNFLPSWVISSMIPVGRIGVEMPGDDLDLPGWTCRQWIINDEFGGPWCVTVHAGELTREACLVVVDSLGTANNATVSSPGR